MKKLMKIIFPILSLIMLGESFGNFEKNPMLSSACLTFALIMAWGYSEIKKTEKILS